MNRCPQCGQEGMAGVTHACTPLVAELEAELDRAYRHENYPARRKDVERIAELEADVRMQRQAMETDLIVHERLTAEVARLREALIAHHDYEGKPHNVRCRVCDKALAGGGREA